MKYHVILTPVAESDLLKAYQFIRQRAPKRPALGP